MKKILSLMMGAVMLLSFTACGQKEEPKPQTPAPEQSVQIGNPYVTCQDAMEMQKEAQLEVSLPQSLPEWVTETIYRAMPGKLVEVIYQGGDNEIRVRIANGSEDISGVYGTDAQEKKDLSAGENTIHASGVTQDGGVFLVYLTTWTADGRTYSVSSTEGVPEEELLPVLEAIK